jgi:hypothetical protein
VFNFVIAQYCNFCPLRNPLMALHVTVQAVQAAHARTAEAEAIAAN